MSKELIEELQDKSTRELLNGMILDHMWLENPAEQCTKFAGVWSVTLRVDQLEELLELARKGLMK